MKQLTNLLSLNKQTNIIATILLLMSLCFVSCGGDDDGSNSKVVDGVNVNTGRKLVRLDINNPYTNSSEYVFKFRIDYDTKGRLSKVIRINSYKYENGTYIEIEAANELLNIDYDFRLIKYKSYSREFDCMFSLNEKGYISEIGGCRCKYDSYGYLTGTEDSRYIFSLAYEEGELIKSMVKNLTKDKIDITYITYGEDSSKGDLLFYMNTTTHFNGMRDVEAVLLFIAYQSGLFGKMTNHLTYLSKTSETSAVLQKKNEERGEQMLVRCAFKFE